MFCVHLSSKPIRLVWPGDVPDLGVAILSGGDQRGAVQPAHPGYLALIVSVPHDAMFVWQVQRPDDDGAVQPTASNVDRVGGPRHTVHLGSVEAPLLLVRLLIASSHKYSHFSIAVSSYKVLLVR